METVEEINRQRLQILIDHYKSQVALAAILDVNIGQISQWLKGSKYHGSKTGKGRAMDRDTKRKIEDKTGMPRGWMDQPIEPDASQGS